MLGQLAQMTYSLRSRQAHSPASAFRYQIAIHMWTTRGPGCGPSGAGTQISSRSAGETVEQMFICLAACLILDPNVEEWFRFVSPVGFIVE